MCRALVAVFLISPRPPGLRSQINCFLLTHLRTRHRRTPRGQSSCLDHGRELGRRASVPLWGSTHVEQEPVYFIIDDALSGQRECSTGRGRGRLQPPGDQPGAGSGCHDLRRRAQPAAGNRRAGKGCATAASTRRRLCNARAENNAPRTLRESGSAVACRNVQQLRRSGSDGTVPTESRRHAAGSF